MKIKTEKDNLLHSLSVVSGVVGSKTTLPILSNILIESEGKNKVRLVGTDLEVAISSIAEMTVLEEGSVTVPAKKLYDITRELPQGEVEITVAKNNSVTVKSGRSLFKIMGLPKDDFPKLPEFSLDQAIEIEQAILKEALQLTSFAISYDETRYVLNGVLMSIKHKKMKMVATDGRRLAFCQKDVDIRDSFSLDVIIPSKTIVELNKQLKGEEKVKILYFKNQILFYFGDTFILSRLIEGHFPNYDQVIPKSEKAITTVDREQFLQAVKRASILTSPESQSVKIDLLKNKLLVSSRSPNMGEAHEELEAELAGEDQTIGFNPDYLMDVLKNLDVEKIQLSVAGPDKPGLLKGKKDTIHVIMPMQLN